MAPEDEQFKRRIEAAVATVQAWEAGGGGGDVDDDGGSLSLLAECRRQIPFSLLRANDSGPLSRPEDAQLSPTARFVQRLARYFKDRMTWVNQPPCVQCGGGGTNNTSGGGGLSDTSVMELRATRGPVTDEEREGQASRVEVYACRNCGHDGTAFPRYNSARTLLRTHAGRCGEYANLFGLYCRAAGLETRYVLDVTDHVWTEVCLPASSSSGETDDDPWCMVDSCEGVIDETSMYEAGWGKQLSYVVAVSTASVVDVTPKYTRQWNTADFSARRRAVTTSEEAGARIIQQINAKLRAPLSPKEQEQLERRMSREAAQLRSEMGLTEWGHQYGRGRISGSLAWKVSRREADETTDSGGGGDDARQKPQTVPSHFYVETYFSARSDGGLEIALQCAPATRHEAVVVNGVPCAVGAIDSLSVVVLDQVHAGCILQSRCFASLRDLAHFCATLPAERIVAVAGKLVPSAEGVNESSELSFELGGFNAQLVSEGILYVGQVLLQPDWAYCCSYKDAPRGFKVQSGAPLSGTYAPGQRKLWTARGIRPNSVIGRLPEATMPLATQLLAGYEQKRAAFLSYLEKGVNCSGYTTKPGTPVYILGETAYPFTRTNSAEDGWTTFLLLPQEFVPDDDLGMLDAPLSSAVTPQFEVPLDTHFFVQALGTHLLTAGQALIPTADALQNTRLVAFYFSAHWCGPCRSFTPVLAEMYQVLKEAYPAHGLEVVFVSSDRDAAGFNQYFGSMPWLAIPFVALSRYQQLLSATYNVRGIPSLVILDSMSGQVVVPNTETRQLVMQACSRGDEAIKFMFQIDWLGRIPPDSKQMLEMLAMSCAGDVDDSKVSSCVSPVPSSYLVRKEYAGKQERIKALIAQLVEEGVDLAEATEAAGAVEDLTTHEQPEKGTLNFGTLNGMFERSLLSDNLSAAGRKFLSSELALQMLKESGSDQLETVLSTALKYLSNCIRSPWTPKFRKFQLSFKVADKITRVDGGLQLLQSFGFDVHGTTDDFVATIPVYADLNAMLDEINLLRSQFSGSL